VDRLNDNRAAHFSSSPNSGSGVADHRVVFTNVGTSHAAGACRVLGDITALACRVRRTNVTPNSFPPILTRTVRRGEISGGWGGRAAGTLKYRASAARGRTVASPETRRTEAAGALKEAVIRARLSKHQGAAGEQTEDDLNEDHEGRGARRRRVRSNHGGQQQGA
jgi:hypothetical protein